MSDNNYRSPAFVLSATNSLALVGITVYAVKRMETMSAEMTAMKKQIDDLTAKMGELQNNVVHIPQIVDGLRKAQTLAVNANRAVADLNDRSISDIEALDELQEQIGAITDALESNGTQISVKPKPRAKQPAKPVRKQPTRQPAEEITDDDNMVDIINKVRASRTKT